jgi:hypothetical protein
MILLAIGILGLICVIAVTAKFPVAMTVIWMLVIETTPEMWLSGNHEAIVGAAKAAGIGLVIIPGILFGWRRDRYNPAFAYTAMFGAGLLHGLYPGLTLLASLRSLIGSAAPFAFSFVQVPEPWRRAVIRTVILGPAASLAVGLVLNLLGLHLIYTVELGALRLAGAGEPAFLGGFALIAIYAGLLEMLRHNSPAEAFLLALNFAILLLTGARTPLALAILLILVTLGSQRRFMALAGIGAITALAVIFLGNLSFIRVIDMAQLGQAGNLSNRQLIWPLFEAAITTSPWVGWGIGAGKVIVPLHTGISTLIGTNAAHNEYLRLGAEGGWLGLTLLILCIGLWAYHGTRHLPPAERTLMRLVFLAFAAHSATDNTMIATTSSVLFIWTTAVFAGAAQPTKEAP